MTIGLAVAGLGGLGQALIEDIVRVPQQFSLVAVQDVRADVLQATAARWGATRGSQRFDDLLEQPDVQAIAVCTPNALHAPQAQSALRAGKDVLVQKPLALSRADAQATIDLAAEHGRVLFVDYTYRFLDTTRLFATTLSGLGAVRSARAMFHNIYGPGADKPWFFDARQSGGGALTDLGVHLLDLALAVFRPTRADLVCADMDDRRSVEHGAHLRLTLDGIPFDLDVSWTAPLPHTEIGLDVVTDAGTHLVWENVDGSFFRFRTVLDGHVVLDRQTTLREDTLRAFADALQARRGPPIDVRVYALLDRAYRRSETTA